MLKLAVATAVLLAVALVTATAMMLAVGTAKFLLKLSEICIYCNSNCICNPALINSYF